MLHKLGYQSWLNLLRKIDNNQGCRAKAPGKALGLARTIGPAPNVGQTVPGIRRLSHDLTEFGPSPPPIDRRKLQISLRIRDM
jgi:hypothetical protein